MEGPITDIDGKFQISVTSKTELIFSYIGYKTLMVGDLGVLPAAAFAQMKCWLR